MSAEKKLPAGWEVKKLGEVCEIRSGTTLSPEFEKPFGDIPYLKVADMNIDQNKVMVTSSSRYVSKEDISKTNIIPIGSTIFPKRGGAILTNKKRITATEICMDLNLMAITPLMNFLLPEFVYNYFLAIDLSTINNGSSIPQINNYQIEPLTIPLPPLSEQKRIVAILDEAFQAIGKAKENAQKNLANARELFEGYLNQVFSNPGKDWEETTLGDEVELLCGFAFKSTSYSVNPSDVPLLRGDNIMQGYLRWDDAKRWPTKDAVAYSRYFLEENDIVLAMDRPWVKAGLKCAKITRDVLPALLVQRVARLRIKNLNSDFLFGVIQSQQFTKHLLELQNGIGVPHISGDQILSFAFHKPTKAQQTEVIHNINQLKDETKRLESIYTKKLAALDELKKSILQKAFSGEL